MSIPRQRGDQRGSSPIVVLLPALTAVGFGWWMLARREYLLVDDAYISFRYAVNFAQGHGLVWNVGEPVEGYTCLSWVLLLSAFARLGWDLTIPAVVLSGAFGLGCLELMRRVLTARVGNVAAHWNVVPLMLLASLPSFAHAMTSGMEETCFAFLCVLGIHLLVLGREQPSMRRWSGVVFAAASLTRPEGPLVAGIAVLIEAFARTSWRARFRELLFPVVCVAVVVVGHTVFRLVYYGYPLPNTFYAKVIFSSLTVERGAAHISGFLLAGGWLLLLGFPKPGFDPGLRRWIVHGYALLIGYSMYLLFVGGDHPRWNRFYVPLLPLALVGVGEQLRIWTERWADARAWFRAWSIAAVHACGYAAIALASLPFSEAVEPIVGVIDRSTKRLMDDVDRFFDEVPQDSFCAVAAIGHVGYRHLGLHILDTWGLTNTHIAHLKVKPEVKFGHDKQDNDYVASTKPDYIYVFALPVPLPGYDLCWPSDNPPAAVYRRAVPLSAADVHLGVPKQRRRRLEPPPACRPPSFHKAPKASP